MPLTDTEFDCAFAEWQKFWPYTGIVAAKPWRALFPHASSSDFDDAQRRCQEIERLAADLADQVGNNVIDEEDALSKLARQYPFLTAKRLRRTWHQITHAAMEMNRK